jgi:hypothetical protein
VANPPKGNRKNNYTNLLAFFFWAITSVQIYSNSPL